MIMTIQELKKSENFFLLAGPCVIEGEDMALRIAERVVKMTDRLDIPYVFKGSYRKANRSKASSFTGIGDREGLLRSPLSTLQCHPLRGGRHLFCCGDKAGREVVWPPTGKPHRSMPPTPRATPAAYAPQDRVPLRS